MVQIAAWLHEVEATDGGVNTYWITGTQMLRASFPFTAEFFLVSKTDPHTKKQLLSHPHVQDVVKTSRYHTIHDQEPISVFQIQVEPGWIRKTYEDLRKHWDGYLYNADLSLWQQFTFQTGLFPYAYAEIEVVNNTLKTWTLIEEYEQLDYKAVPFRILWFQPFFEKNGHSWGKITGVLFRETLEKENDEHSFLVEGTSAEEILSASIEYLHAQDPDLVLTQGGDTFFAVIAQQAVEAGLGDLRLGRGTRSMRSYLHRPKTKRGHSYMSYGRVFFYQHGIYFDGGSHHYDVGNSFMWKEGDITGIHELVRLSCSDPQRIARGTIGTTLSAVQMRTAYNQKTLIPSRKADAEAFRPAWTMETDVGGLVFSPQVGFHANASEFDFQSMYPNIMVYRNVSPETVNCACCTSNPQQKVPLTNYHVCTKRPGIVSLSLKNILNRRRYYKSKRNIDQECDRRQRVLKWLLVCCFGYQGYRNARFGRIESHETISAYSRHGLTLTQQIVSKYGLEVIAGIVDSIWVKDQSEEPLPLDFTRDLRQEIAEIVDLPVEHEADYHWIIFLPRRHEPEVGVLNRYYGLRKDGTFKIRGIEVRQSSSPPFIKQLQHKMMNNLKHVRTREQFLTASKQAEYLMHQAQQQLATRDVPLEELLITMRASRAPEDYVSNARQAIAARQLAKIGLPLEPGMKLTYLNVDVSAKNPFDRIKVDKLITGKEKYDVKEYQKLCKRAYESLIPPEFERKERTLEVFL